MDERISPEAQEEERRQRVLATAQGILDGRIGIIEGCRVLSLLRYSFTDDSADPDFAPFVAVDAATGNLNVSSIAEIGDPRPGLGDGAAGPGAEDLFRDDVMRACRNLLAKHGPTGEG